MWIECKIGFQDKALAEMDIQTEGIDSWVPSIINAEYIIAVTKYLDDDEEIRDDIVEIRLRDGATYVVQYSFEKLKVLVTETP